MRNRGRRKKLTLAQQYLFLRNNPVCEGTGELTPTLLKWHFDALPSPLGRSYQIEISLSKHEAFPDVFVRSPNIEVLAAGRELPHVYHEPLRLCLFQPAKNQWHKGLRLDETIVPWTVLWLYYFEDWLVNDEWRGGGDHPGENEPLSHNRQFRRSWRSDNIRSYRS